jgi:hypothetical protein
MPRRSISPIVAAGTRQVTLSEVSEAALIALDIGSENRPVVNKS